ncbi:Methyltransf-25 domain-containing protein [Mycena indigotica]|uniref:Methyltransf-25 domain-containing protein n=1 Tax=Mycena indigotica TaxID=2126181 RepID=A0A8H6WF11_9AGAR|nr:Methyltransf-25 domain-containing protein [Mycena indigotica]KAF7312408.1 Methyltransf-25 domain-containing protein [Mycena indigotica]
MTASAPAPFGSAPQNAQKEVQAVLLKQRPSRRRIGDVPFPMRRYSSELVNYDNWDQMFFKSCYGGITAHKFEPENPPQVILDLGCGGGNWAIEAARQWPDAHVIGFDLFETQPRLMELDAFYMRCLEDVGQPVKSLPIANELGTARIEWVHGNMSAFHALDGLPFPSDYFDFVHIANIGLGVPEDEWQFVLEEVCRILQPSGILEVSHRFPELIPTPTDLFFAYRLLKRILYSPVPPPHASRPRQSLAPLNLDFTRRDRRDSSTPPSAFSSRTSSTLFSDLWSLPDSISPDDTPLQKKPSLPTLPEGFTDNSRNSIPFDVDATLTRRDTLFQNDLDSMIPQTTDSGQHPQDHQRLKSAWESMLSRRFLASSVTTVLPFYLSSFFENVQSHPAVHIPLPQGSMGPDPDSRSSGESFDADLFDLAPSSKRLADPDMRSIKSRSTGSSQRIVHSWGRMHLGKAVATVSACKEALWAEYQKLYPNDLPPTLQTKTARPSGVNKLRALKHSPREAFETDWSNWENDMADRMSMRATVHSEFGWKQPEPSPEARTWKNHVMYHREEGATTGTRSNPELCRLVRAFVGWKPAAEE